MRDHVCSTLFMNLLHAADDGTAQKSANTQEGRTDLPLFSTKNEVARVLSCTTRHIDNLVRRRLLRVTRVGRLIRFRRETVLKCLERLEVQS